MTRQDIATILAEIGTVLGKVDEQEVNELVGAIRSARKIALVGAGRVGMAVRGFAMRLAHLGLDAHMLGDATVPSISEGDLLLVASGSGETQTIYDLVAIAKKNNARIALITGNPESRMGTLADVVVKVEAPSKTKLVADFISVQPMTTLNEQCLGIFFDAVVLRLMKDMGETHETMWGRHSNLE
ncbi:MAG: 6-phospho-3-hexuloisomerase [Patescibacteria group bacterium]